MDLDLPSSEDLIEKSWLGTYKKDIEHIWDQLVNLNTNIFILEKIYKFPFDALKIDRSLFWQMAFIGLYEICIIIIYRLVADNMAESTNIQRFKNGIIIHMKNDEYRSQFFLKLKSTGLDNLIKSLKPRIIELRNRRIAHYDINWNKDITVSELNKIALGYNELLNILKSLNEYFDILCFAEKRSVTYIDYSSEHRKTDIESILDDIAKKSRFLNMPEQQKEIWPHFRKDLSDHTLAIFNEYRRKFNLEEV